VRNQKKIFKLKNLKKHNTFKTAKVHYPKEWGFGERNVIRGCGSKFKSMGKRPRKGKGFLKKHECQKRGRQTESNKKCERYEESQDILRKRAHNWGVGNSKGREKEKTKI